MADNVYDAEFNLWWEEYCNIWMEYYGGYLNKDFPQYYYYCYYTDGVSPRKVIALDMCEKLKALIDDYYKLCSSIGEDG